MRYEGWKIRYGFLTGNLFSGWTSQELDQIDVPRSISNYAQKTREKLEASFPGAEVEVLYQDRSGVIPADIKSYAFDPSGDEHVAESQDVEYWGERAFDDDTWQVPR